MVHSRFVATVLPRVEPHALAFQGKIRMGHLEPEKLRISLLGDGALQGDARFADVLLSREAPAQHYRAADG